MKNKMLFIGILFSTSFFACDKGGNKPVENTEVRVVEKQVDVPSFNADSAYLFIAKQVAFGPRVPNTSAHRNTGAYLEKMLKENGAEVTIQNFEATAYDGKILFLENIIGSFNPKAKKRILLAAHWDTRPFADQDTVDQRKPIDGANDGASGVGILLELARTIGQAAKKPEVGVDIIFFDGEDYGQPDFDKGKGNSENSWCLGSQYWSKNKHKENYSAYYGILLDMAGAKDARFAMEGASMRYAPSIVKKVWSTAQKNGFGDVFVFEQVPGIIDDHAYVNDLAKIPMIDIIEYNGKNDRYFGDYWHTHNDNMDVIGKGTLKAVGQTLLEVLYRE